MKKAILATLLYADLFDFPLKAEEIWEGLIAEKGVKGLEFRSLKKNLEDLVKKQKIGIKEDYYFLLKRESIVGLRQKRGIWSLRKIKKAKKIIFFLKFIPWIKLIGISGGLSRLNADKDDDIDLFFIVQPDRLWLARGLVVLILSLLGVYRRPEKIKDTICPNMFVSLDNLEITPKDLFTAYEVYLMKPIVQKDNVYLQFLQKNSWIKNFLPFGYESRIMNSELRIKKERSMIHDSLFPAEPRLAFGGMIQLERLAKFLQKQYMRSKITSETISDTLLKFHPHDLRQSILSKFQKKLSDLTN